MTPSPPRPGESKEAYSARVKAAEAAMKARMEKAKGRPRVGVAIDPARPRPGTGTMPTPKTTPKVSRTPIRPGRPGSTGMKSGGMVKGKKK